MTLRQRLVESLVQSVGAYYRTNLEQSAKYNHVEHLGVLHLGSLVHGINAIDGNVLALWRIDDSIAVINKDSSSLHLGLKLIERRLVEHDGHIVMAEDRR